MTAAKMSKKGKKKRVDMTAAQLILQCYLDQISRSLGQDEEFE
jgi:RNase H-fold protein (predicted Holliday junction resolvase)